jgi:pyruvate ferredoxin oxidoreductase alpha subunit
VPLYQDIATSLINRTQKPILINKIYGLGGRDYMPDQAEKTLDELIQIARDGKVKSVKEYIGVRE